MSRLSLFLYIMSLLASSALAQSTQTEQQYGLWEGISAADMQFHILELNENKPHRYIVSAIGNGFKHGTIKPFTAQDIQCNNLRCIIQLPTASKHGEKIQLITSADGSGGFNVLRLNLDATGKHISSEQFQLKKSTDGSSTIKQFLQQHISLLKNLTDEPPQDLSGVWLGILTMDGQHDLLQLQINPGKKSLFIRYITGSNLTNETQFTDIEKQNGSYFVNTTHLTFANKLIILPLTSSLIEGYFYSTYQGTPLEDGTFRLIWLGNPRINPQN